MEYSVSESLNDANSSSGRRRHTGLKSHREDTLSVDRGFAQMEIRRRKEKDKMIQTSLYRKILEMEHNLEKCGKDLERTSDQTEKTRIDISKLIERKRYLEGELRHTRMTFSRRCAKFLAKYEWYYPVINRPQGVHLDAAWSYFEHVTLPRFFCDEHSVKGDGLEKASPGEYDRETKLYSTFGTPLSELGKFGIGIGLYFTTLCAIGIITFIAGIINTPLIAYYESDKYRGDSNLPQSVFLAGSAICTNRTWVACEGCTANFAEKELRTNMIAKVGMGSFDEIQSDALVFVNKNWCEFPPFEYAIIPFISVCFLYIAFVALDRYLELAEVRYDENEQTAQDYSILVSNPPPEALDPNEWRQFFQEQTRHRVTIVSITINNKSLIEALYLRRIKLRQLNKTIEAKYLQDERFHNKEYKDIDPVKRAECVLKEAEEIIRITQNDVNPRSLGEIFMSILTGMFNLASANSDLLPIVRSIRLLEERIYECYQENYDATGVFVTFEKEEGQRAALQAFDYGKAQASFQKHGNDIIPTFRGKILKITEPAEPSTINYLEMGTPITRSLFRMFLAICVTLAFILACCFVVIKMREISTLYAAICISVFNVAVPVICKKIHNIESHSARGSSMNSLYLKITLFRWANTAIIISAITPFTLCVSDGDGTLLPTVLTIFIAELLTSPLLRLLDVGGLFKKHFLAPRTTSQDEMNLLFKGTEWSLAERYTDLTKILFLTFYYSYLFPAGYFLCTVALFVYYFSDKFCLFRVWSPAPMIGTQLASFSRKYFFTSSLLGLVTVSTYFIIMFPFDNLCESPNGSIPAGTYSVVYGDETAGALHFENQIPIFMFCEQEVIKDQTSFPTLLEEFSWHDRSQESLAHIYGISSIAVLLLLALFNFGGLVVECLKSWFIGSYETCGISQQIDFSNVKEIFGYVPQIQLDSFEYPLLVCDTSDVNPSLIGWEPASKGHDYFNLTYDIPYDDNIYQHLEKVRLWKSSYNKDTSGPFSSLKWMSGFFVPNTSAKSGLITQNQIESTHIDNGAENSKVSSTFEPDEHSEVDEVPIMNKPCVKFSIVKHYPMSWSIHL